MAYVVETALYVALQYPFGGFAFVQVGEAPVSYTHLDVYKRQILNIVQSQGRCIE